jgi:hypothetical protein
MSETIVAQCLWCGVGIPEMQVYQFTVPPPLELARQATMPNLLLGPIKGEN